MDWQILAALGICSVSLLAYWMMRPGVKPPQVIAHASDDQNNVQDIQAPARQPHHTQVDPNVLDRFTAAFQQAR